MCRIPVPRRDLPVPTGQSLLPCMSVYAVANGRYRLEVLKNGRLGPATLFAFASPGVPDGVHCDTKGNVYSGLGDGIHVWNSEGTLLGKIYVGATSANFQVRSVEQVKC